MTWAGVATCPPGEHHGTGTAGHDDASGPDGAHLHGGASHAHNAHPGDDASPAPDAHPHADASHAHDGHRHGDGQGTSGPAGGSGFDCSLFHFVAIEPLTAAPQPIQCAAVAVNDIAGTGHESHIPDGLERPNWRPAASFGETFPF